MHTHQRTLLSSFQTSTNVSDASHVPAPHHFDSLCVQGSRATTKVRYQRMPRQGPHKGLAVVRGVCRGVGPGAMSPCLEGSRTKAIRSWRIWKSRGGIHPIIDRHWTQKWKLSGGNVTCRGSSALALSCPLLWRNECDIVCLCTVRSPDAAGESAQPSRDLSSAELLLGQTSYIKAVLLGAHSLEQYGT